MARKPAWLSASALVCHRVPSTLDYAGGLEVDSSNLSAPMKEALLTRGFRPRRGLGTAWPSAHLCPNASYAQDAGVLERGVCALLNSFGLALRRMCSVAREGP